MLCCLTTTVSIPPRRRGLLGRRWLGSDHGLGFPHEGVSKDPVHPVVANIAALDLG